jgi:hypothetical protein
LQFLQNLASAGNLLRLCFSFSAAATAAMTEVDIFGGVCRFSLPILVLSFSQGKVRSVYKLKNVQIKKAEY